MPRYVYAALDLSQSVNDAVMTQGLVTAEDRDAATEAARAEVIAVCDCTEEDFEERIALELTEL